MAVALGRTPPLLIQSSSQESTTSRQAMQHPAGDQSWQGINQALGRKDISNHSLEESYRKKILALVRMHRKTSPEWCTSWQRVKEMQLICAHTQITGQKIHKHVMETKMSAEACCSGLLCDYNGYYYYFFALRNQSSSHSCKKRSLMVKLDILR